MCLYVLTLKTIGRWQKPAETMSSLMVDRARQQGIHGMPAGWVGHA